jgi:carbon storage regulator
MSVRDSLSPPRLARLYRRRATTRNAAFIRGSIIQAIFQAIILAIIQGGIPMLVLSRRESERIRVGDSIVVTVVRVSGDKVRLGIEAPADMLVLREELKPHAAELVTPAPG